MKSVLFSKISTENGLIEQVLSLVNSIWSAKQYNKKVIILDSFKNDNIAIPCCEVIDLEHLNNFLKQKGEDILIVDKTCINYKINAILSR